MPTSLEMVQPFWNTTTMFAESVLFVQAGRDVLAKARLAFTPRKIVAVQLATMEERFAAGRDYQWVEGTRELVLTAGSGIPFKTEGELYPPKGTYHIGGSRNRDAALLFGEGDFFHRMQAVVTYEHGLDGWETPGTLEERFSLPHVSALLRQKQAVKLLVLGDSISAGGNASARSKAPPFQPAYPDILASAITEKFGCPVHLTNLSVGGKNSVWGCEQLPAAIAARPDLAILAFGMNDAAKLSTAEYAGNMRTMVETLRREVPGMDIVVVATMTGNPDWVGSSPALYPEYRDALWTMRGPGVAVADVTTVWEILATRKSYLDLTGNGVNHPNDFGHRVYAQVIWSILAGVH